MYNWHDSYAYGAAEEKRVIEIMKVLRPDLGFKEVGGKDKPDGECVFGGVEIKSYSVWYCKPCIEVKQVDSGKASLWVSDESIKLLIINHSGWLHLYNCDKLRWHVTEGEEFPIFYAEVSQGSDGYSKRMKFINIRDRSTLKSYREHPDCDDLRWNCSMVKENNPYITSLNLGAINIPH